MKRRWLAFNIYLSLLALLFLSAGCHTDAAGKKKKGKESAVVDFHLQVQWNDNQHTETISVYRANPITLRVNAISAIEHVHIVRAEIIEDNFGSYAIKIQLNRQGTWLLENISISNRGSRLAILCRSDQARWLAAPFLDHRIQDGSIVFTPDATRAEAEAIVKGINNIANVKSLKDF